MSEDQNNGTQSEESLSENNTPLSPDLEAALRDAEAHAEDLEAKKADTNQAKVDDQELKKLKEDLEAAQKLNAEMRDGMMRARADLENARRRFEREQKESQLYAEKKFKVIDSNCR